MSELFDRLFSTDPAVRAATLIDLPDAPPADVDQMFEGLRPFGAEGFRWDERFAKTAFAKDRSGLRAYLNVVLGYAPETCRVVNRAAGRIALLTLGGSDGVRVPISARFDFRRFRAASAVTLELATLDDLDGLATLPRLVTLTLKDVEARTPGSLRLRGVKSMLLAWVRGVERIAAPGLETLGLQQAGMDLDGLEGLDELARLRLFDAPYTDFRGLPGLRSLTRLEADECAALASCEGLGAAPELREVSLARCPALASLAGLPDSLTSLELDDLPGLRTLEGLPNVGPAGPGLERVRLGGARRRVDLAPLAALPTLTVLDLRGSKGVRSVERLLAHPTLRAVLLEGTSVSRSGVPPRERWRCSWAKNPHVDEMIHRTPPDPATWDALKGEGRVTLARIRKLLRSPDVEVIDQGLELLRVVDEPAVYDALLEGTDYRQVRQASRISRRPWRLGSRRFVGPTRSYVLHRLLADAPEDSSTAARLRERIHCLDFVESGYPPEPHPLDLRSLAALPALEALCFGRFGPLTLEDDDDPGTVPRLRRLEVLHQPSPLPNAWLAAQTSLESALLVGEHAGSRDLRWAGGLPRLRSLEINQQSQLDLSGLQGSSSLEELSIWSCSGLSRLEGLPDGLRTVKVSWCWQLTDLGCLLELDSLREFRRYGCAIPDDQIARLEARGVTILP